METITLTPKSFDEAAAKAAAVLRGGGVVLYPTETLYGLGADALSDEAVARVAAIKGRSIGKPIHALVADEAMAARFGEIDANARALITHIEKPLSLIVRKKEGADSGILHGMDTFGFRIAQHPFCAALVRAFDGPVTTTSANKAGRLPERSVSAILEQLGSAADGIDLVVDAGELSESLPSTIVDLSLAGQGLDSAQGGGPAIIREGAVPVEEVWGALGIER